MSSRTSTRHETHTLRGCSARGNARGDVVALLKAMFVVRRLGLWRSSLRVCTRRQRELIMS
ncbi:hypothetical protein DVH24_014997 [Malus domestica]|uniref:Uncharacterized protein n=1 Tax=Malus domestica TaxID=3750 RepID=A0A498K2U0_MALDO|nr:hypothetical protein DVH24_014997 [Malus domestica]